MNALKCFPLLLLSLFSLPATPGLAVDLLKQYPTPLTTGDTTPERARPWEVAATDIFELSKFRLSAGAGLQVEVGPADLGIGHCADGAVWAVLVPRQGGTLKSNATDQEETISHVWLRFHPKEVARLFPPETVPGRGQTNLLAQIRVIASAKMRSSFQAGGLAMIPEPKDAIVDADIVSGPRRFFIVDAEAGTAKYVAAFEARAIKEPLAVTATLATAAFDQLWEAFERDYAMFALRPEVDWAERREVYRPRALASKTTYEFASACAEMLAALRDLHVILTVANSDISVFNRPRVRNANPAAYAAILGELKNAGRVPWAITTNQIGFIAINGWSEGVVEQCDEILEKLRDTRGLIVDVRLNGGGSEPLAKQVAGRFLEKDFTYAFHQTRNGPKHTDLSEKRARVASPRGPWRYQRPVVVLIGQKCMSSNESFIAMMSGNTNAIILGDHTCGSSGNPKVVRLPLDMTVTVPQWIDYLPDGTPLDERGFQPQVPFKATTGAFEGKRDDLLSAALQRLAQAPFPEDKLAK